MRSTYDCDIVQRLPRQQRWMRKEKSKISTTLLLLVQPRKINNEETWQLCDWLIRSDSKRKWRGSRRCGILIRSSTTLSCGVTFGRWNGGWLKGKAINKAEGVEWKLRKRWLRWAWIELPTLIGSSYVLTLQMGIVKRIWTVSATTAAGRWQNEVVFEVWLMGFYPSECGCIFISASPMTYIRCKKHQEEHDAKQN